jgi:hypothetical protein
MTGDCHVRFCERLGAKLPRPTDHAVQNAAAFSLLLKGFSLGPDKRRYRSVCAGTELKPSGCGCGSIWRWANRAASIGDDPVAGHGTRTLRGAMKGKYQWK